MPVTSVISADDVVFRYNSAEVLSNVSFRLGAGDYLGIVGPNGSGKTTLIKLLLGFIRASSGRVALFGQDPDVFDKWCKIGYLPQKAGSMNPHFPATVREIVALGLIAGKRFPRWTSTGDSRRIDRALELMEISRIRYKLIGELSGGQQQRVLIARALVSEPEVLILDEPTTALDPEAREKFFSVLEKMNTEKNVSVVIVTHDIGTIGKYASKLLYLDKKVIFFGGFDDFCKSADMGNYFGEFTQHIICHRHD